MHLVSYSKILLVILICYIESICRMVESSRKLGPYAATVPGDGQTERGRTFLFLGGGPAASHSGVIAGARVVRDGLVQRQPKHRADGSVIRSDRRIPLRWVVKRKQAPSTAMTNLTIGIGGSSCGEEWGAYSTRWGFHGQHTIVYIIYIIGLSTSADRPASDPHTRSFSSSANSPGAPSPYVVSQSKAAAWR